MGACGFDNALGLSLDPVNENERKRRNIATAMAGSHKSCRSTTKNCPAVCSGSHSVKEAAEVWKSNPLHGRSYASMYFNLLVSVRPVRTGSYQPAYYWYTHAALAVGSPTAPRWRIRQAQACTPVLRTSTDLSDPEGCGPGAQARVTSSLM